MSGALTDGFLLGCRPPADLPIEEWIEKNVRLGSWARSPKLDLEATPWMVAPLKAAEGNEMRVIVLRWPTGSGKSTFFEGLIAWIVAEDAGPCQVTHMTDDQARRWVETRLVPVLELSDPTREILGATHRHKKRKLEVIMPHMFILFGGAGLSRLQDVSIQWVLAQECHGFLPGTLGEAKARTHDRWNSREIYCSQGSLEGSDFEQEDADCEQMDWAFLCPECGERVRYLGEGEPLAEFRNRMTWDEEMGNEDEVDWESLGETVRLRCDCGAEFKDEVGQRRHLTGSGEYVSRGNRHKPAQVSFSFPVMAVWWVPWRKTVERYLAAERAAMKGDLEPRRQFIEKRLGRNYEEASDTPDVVASDYSRGDYFDGEKWEDEAFRFLTVDVQKGHFWAIVRAWKIGGDSRLLWEGKVSTIEGVRDLQERMGVPNWSVGIDSRYRPELVAKWRARYAGESPNDSWTMLMGEDTPGYPLKVRRVIQGKPQVATVRRPFSQWANGRSGEGVKYRFLKHSNLLIKDLLSGLIGGEGVAFEVMRDHSDDYAKHMKSEVKREVRPGKWRWEKVKPHYRNDLWDCECMGVVLACIKGVLRAESEPED